MRALTAITRFGLGPRSGDLAAAAPDPQGWVLAQLTPPAPIPPGMAALPGLEELARETLGAQAALRLAIQEGRRAAAAGAGDPDADGVDAARRERGRTVRGILRREVEARLDAALSTDRPLVERLVLFFGNHFAIAADNAHLRALTGHFERSLRPHVLGRFRDLLGAAVLHPAMLAYLDNTASVGPNSRAGRRKGRSYNENLARELLELHTLGADGGYSQDDVIALALVLTGWTGGFELRRGEGPEMQELGPAFQRALHEPGPKTILGRTYEEAGAAEVDAVLDDLAAHPATARHISAKLARHFVGDEVSVATVEAMAAAFRDTDGDLGAVMRTLVSSEEAWTAPRRRVLPPYDFLVSAYRAFSSPAEFGPLRDGSAALGQPIWNPPSPAGWPDHNGAWLGGDLLLERLDWATAFAGETAPEREDIAADALSLLGDAAEGELLTALARAEGRVQAMTLLLMSPQWQLR